MAAGRLEDARFGRASRARSIKARKMMPDIVVHDTRRNLLVSAEAVSAAGAVEGKQAKGMEGTLPRLPCRFGLCHCV
jgi:hypothetical protein